MSAPGWLDAARVVPTLEVVRELALSLGRDGKSFGPCPNCGAERRSNPGRSLDKRGRCRLLPDGKGWACCSNGTDGCGAKGDGPGLVAWTLLGRQWGKGDHEASSTVRQWYAERGWCEAWTGGVHPLSTPVHPRPRVHQASPVEPPPARPPAAEVAELWARCVPVVADAEVAAWLAGRDDGAIDPELVAALDLARALPADLAKLPRWARYKGKPWTQSGHRVVVQVWEADPDNAGLLRVAGLHARNILPKCIAENADDCPTPGRCGKHDKAGWPSGAQAVRLIFATTADPRGGLQLVELAEGVPDWLRLALDRAARPERSAVWGVTAGSASPELAELVPAGWPVVVRTHDDDAGNKYAEAWRKLLAARGCKLYRKARHNGTAQGVSTPVQPCPPPAEPGDLRVAREGLRNSTNGPELATVWALICRKFGGADNVPAELVVEHLTKVATLDPINKRLHDAQLRELVTQ